MPMGPRKKICLFPSKRVGSHKREAKKFFFATFKRLLSCNKTLIHEMDFASHAYNPERIHAIRYTNFSDL